MRRRVQLIGPWWGSVDQQNGNALFVILVSVDGCAWEWGGRGALTSMTASCSSMTIVTGWLMMGILRRIPALSIKISCNAWLTAANWVGGECQDGLQFGARSSWQTWVRRAG